MSERMMCWENELCSDVWLYTDDGLIVGKVQPRGASFECWYRTDEHDSLIAFRPTLREAQKCVAKYHQAATEAARGV